MQVAETESAEFASNRRIQRNKAASSISTSKESASLRGQMKHIEAEVKAELEEVNAGNAELKAGNAELKAGNADMKAELEEVNADNAELKADLKAQGTMLGQILAKLTGDASS